MSDTQYPAKRGTYQGEYYGEALTSFLKALGSSQAVLQDILGRHGLDTIDPETWYDLELARSIYYDVGRLVGPQALYNVGVQILTSAVFPPGIDGPESALTSIDAAYRMNTRGPELGSIVAEVEEDSARMLFSTPFPCRLDQGICAGACEHFGFTPIVEHRGAGCRDRGDTTCEYQVSW